MTDRWHGEVTWVWVLVGGFAVGQAVLGVVDLALGTARVGVVGHVTGVCIGIGLGLVGPTDGSTAGDAADAR